LRGIYQGITEKPLRFIKVKAPIKAEYWKKEEGAFQVEN
jgi:hypothetical protein